MFMAEETKVDEFLGDLTREDADPLKQKLEEVFPTTEKKEEGEIEEEVKEKPLPFHRDPKLQKYIEKEISKRMAEFEPEEKESPETDEKLKTFAEKLIGNDTPEKIAAAKEFVEILKEREERGADLAEQRLSARESREAQEEAEADNELIEGFETIEESFGVDITSDSPQSRKLRGEFIEFIRKVAPKNDEGEVMEFPDLEQTFDAFQSTRQINKTTNRAKELAARGTERGGSAATAPSGEDKSWAAVDRAFDKLAG
jgi:hypothetical protein